MAIQAVITGDIVNFTKLSPAGEKKLLRTLQQVLAPFRHEFYRGDSFQVFQQDAGQALRTALICRTAAIATPPEKKETPSDVRISIGIDHMPTPDKTLNLAQGAAFVLSGRSFDEMMGSARRMVITTSNPLANSGLQVMSSYVDALFRELTRKQAEVFFELLRGQTQQAVAEKLKKSKSTINQHVSSGRWEEIEILLNQFEHIINQLS